MYGLNHWMEGPTTVQYCSDQSLSSWLRLNGTMQLQLQQRWHCGLELKGQ
jgi:hypothetical protein